MCVQTFAGGFRAFNRIGMDTEPSPLGKMSFETTTKFLIDAVTRSEIDDLSSPSARIALGQLVRGGTGSFDVGVDCLC